MTRPILLLLAALPACAAGADDAASLDVRARLAEPVTFTLAPTEAKTTVRARHGDDAGVADLVVTSGTLAASVDDDDRVVLDDLTLAFADVRLPRDIYPGNLVLTDIQVHLAKPVTCDDTAWAEDGDAASCDAATDLTLEWKLVVEGKAHPLTPQTLPGFALGVDLYRGDDRLVLDVDAHAEGVVWSYLDITLADAATWFRSSDDPRIVL